MEKGIFSPMAIDALGEMMNISKNGGNCTERLHLHAQRLEFIFPVDGRHYCFECPVPF